MSYINPLHPPIRSTHQSYYSSIGGALQNRSLSPNRRPLPQRPFALASKSRSAPAYAPIIFDHPGCSQQGVPMRELVARSGTGMTALLQGAGDLVFACTGLVRITLKIMWPGYEHLDWASPIDLTYAGSGPITRAQLAASVSHGFARFTERARKEYCRSTEWSLVSSGIRFEQLVLLSLFNVCEDIWQADVAINL
ncbi:hypothetical protein H0H92_004569 [Tricholoma furcatifolium]|nr:hypothetical protein H0H92_004569 [Tricholoma furcatifolium]